MDFKNIKIGEAIEARINELQIDESRILNFFKNNIDLSHTYQCKELSTDELMKWSKLLEYDFFRLYSQHLILYSPLPKNYSKKSTLPSFKKCIYTREIIDFVLELINTDSMTKKEIIDRYNIPKTTLYKWISKYNSKLNENG